MYEFTMGGAWFNWSELDATSKRLAGVSITAAGVAAVPIGMGLGEVLSDVVGEIGRHSHPGVNFAQPWMAWVFLVGAVISAYFWWRFSLRQDEMFNRVQNWTFGMAGSWTMAGVLVWLALNVAGVASPPDVVAIAVAFYAALMGFWFIAVRRWA